MLIKSIVYNITERYIHNLGLKCGYLCCIYSQLRLLVVEINPICAQCGTQLTPTQYTLSQCLIHLGHQTYALPSLSTHC